MCCFEHGCFGQTGVVGLSGGQGSLAVGPVGGTGPSASGLALAPLTGGPVVGELGPAIVGVAGGPMIGSIPSCMGFVGGPVASQAYIL